jgi:hypothetical protein
MHQALTAWNPGPTPPCIDNRNTPPHTKAALHSSFRNDQHLSLSEFLLHSFFHPFLIFLSTLILLDLQLSVLKELGFEDELQH